MRISRFRKLKSKNQGFWFIAKIALIWYLFLFSTTYFTSTTSAVFSSKVEPKGSIEAADWLRGQYELEFERSGNPHRSCMIDTVVRNIGPGDMTEDVIYDVFYVENGNPVKGEKVGEGRINALKNSESEKVSYEANKTGRYVFIVNEQDKKVESKKFIVECNPTTNPEQEIEENNANKEADEEVIENKDEQNKTENKAKSIQTESAKPKHHEEQVKEEKTEKSSQLNQTTDKPIEQKTIEDQEPAQEQQQKKIETKPEVESSQEQENKEGVE
ncbi:amyloid fiber anchoring/assembly protein TapA [Oceanobacillus caeni]|uniref:amyloid fiber anchoring/assembly protein TapA n=1 Tax=Oceanobacillus caeni TaxID=405946 RepID=UPI00195D4EBF